MSLFIKHFKEFWRGLFKFAHTYRKFLVFLALLYAFWFFGLGMIGGYLLNKGSLSDLPTITKEDKILFIAPHIDDEVIGTGGVIQEAINSGAKVKIVYLTSGDGSIGAILGEQKKADLQPNEFIALGEKRMEEAKKATGVLGMKEDDLIFLGFPDGGMKSMLTTYYKSLYTSQATKFNYNPYKGTYREQQKYAGANVVVDLNEILKDFQPTIVFVSHPRDKHPDHNTAYRYLEKALVGQPSNPLIYSYLVHYSLYPAQKKLLQNQFMYPPNNLFTQEGWYSFDLSNVQQDRKIKAIDENISQIETPTMDNFLHSFVRRNEIFELLQ